MMFKELFDQHEDEHTEFERIPAYARLHERRDICALMYLHSRFGGKGKVIAGANHDIIYLGSGKEELTEEDVIYLRRCGVLLDSESDSLAMFV